MNRRSLAWMGLCVLAVAGAAYAFFMFPRAFPLVSLDVSMDRASALAEARRVAEEHGWGPASPRQAASFGLDESVQSFVELEAGGSAGFARLLKSGLYEPYTWTVRNFREHETNETLVSFTPEGRLYEFRETLAEDAPGAKLDAAHARQRAEAFVAQGWDVDLSQYKLVESSQEIRPGGRIDHTLVYERPHERLGEGRYRLRLVVSGDRVTELTHFIQIPEAFERRFKSMRSLNNTIAMGATGFIAVVYVVGACGVGLFLLLRRRALQWRKPLAWAVAIGALLCIKQLTDWPLAWMGYDTAVSAASFSLSQVVSALGTGLGMGALVMLAAVAGEGMGRWAFPHHVQLWRAWSLPVASTRTVLRQTLIPLLLLGPMFAYLTTLYAFAKEYLGWWNPSYALIDPNVLASYAPWLGPVAIPLEAGVLEECLFRAVPLSAAALLGKRFGGRRIWIGVVLVLQALVFGAAHANYPAQPAYARMVEIGIPFLFVGLAYVAYGLLPAILLHFGVDAIFFGMPLFAVSGHGVWIDRAIAIALALTPLWVVLVARLRTGRWSKLTDDNRNAGWFPAERPADSAVAPEEPARPGLSSRRRLVLVLAGLAGLVAWAWAGRFQADVPALDVSRSAATAAARAALADRGVTLTPPWQALPTMGGDAGEADRFVWEEGGPAVYHKILGSHLEAPHWIVRFARFEGDLADRAEEYRVHVDARGTAYRVQHIVPEARPGASLDESAARELAYSTLAQSFDLDRSAVREISAEPSQRPSRRDWTFVFVDPHVDVGKGGEARIDVEIIGDQVGDVLRFIHLPEQWERADRDRLASTGIVGGVAQASFVIVFVLGSILGIVRWSRRRFAHRSALVAFLFVVGVAALAAFNRWPVVHANFPTDRPFGLELGQVIVYLTMLALATAAGVALAVGLTHRALRVPRGNAVFASIGLGVALAGITALLERLAPASMPTWPSFGALATAVPVVGVGLAPLLGFVFLGVLLLLVLSLVDGTTHGWRVRRWLGALIVLGAGLIIAGRNRPEDMGWWLLAALGVAAALLVTYVLVLRHDLGLLPGSLATMVILGLVRVGAMRLFPALVPGTLLAVVLVAGVAWVWTRRFRRDAQGAVVQPTLTEPSQATPTAE